MRSIFDKAYIKQWSIGVGKYEHHQLINKPFIDTKINWLTPDKSHILKADPFIFYDAVRNEYHILYEYFDMFENFGKIKSVGLNPNLTFDSEDKFTLNIGTHLSYPFVLEAKNSFFVIPESSKSNDLTGYEIDGKGHITGASKTIIKDNQLLDCTFLFHNKKHWIFATKRGANSNSELHIYHSNSWDGPYLPHQNNPVKSTLFGSRPAGNIFQYKNELYRPAQNCTISYGKSVVINRIITLNELTFEEETVNEIFPQNENVCKEGIHTINICNDVIVIDGLQKIFHPYNQIKSFLLKSFKLLINITIFNSSFLFELPI